MIAVAKWSKALVSSFYVRSRDSPMFEPSHGAHRQATLVLKGGFGHRPQYLTCSIWADSGRYMSVDAVTEYLLSFWTGKGKTATERR